MTRRTRLPSLLRVASTEMNADSFSDVSLFRRCKSLEDTNRSRKSFLH